MSDPRALDPGALNLGQLDPAALAARGGGEAALGLPPARGVAFHSGRVRPGDAFFALPGAAQHGLAFADAALAAGAAYIVSDRAHPQGVRIADPAGLLLELGREARAQLRGVVVGVTGSAGKTSCKALLAAALGAGATPGNFNTPLALAQALIDAALTGRTGEEARLVLELGIDHPGEMDALVDLTRPTHAVLTLIAPSHLSALGTLAGVAHEKLKLVDAAAHSFVSAQAAPYLNETQRRRVSVYGLDEGADVRGEVTDSSTSGQTLQALGERVRLPFVGSALAENALAALALAHALGDEISTAARRLEGAKLEPGRLQVHRLGALTLLDDSYNSNPASALAALAALGRFPGPRSAVLGDMLELGPESAHYHERLGEHTRDLDRVIAVGPEMRALLRTNPSAHHLETFDLKTLRPLLPERGALLVKGSRGTRLERLVEALLAGTRPEGVRA